MKTYTKLTAIFICEPIREPVEYVMQFCDNTEKEKEDFIKARVAEITKGCNYKYEYICHRRDFYFFK